MLSPASGEDRGGGVGEDRGGGVGGAALLGRQLEYKFGVLDAETERRIAGADSDQLLRWAGLAVALSQRTERISVPLSGIYSPRIVNHVAGLSN
jgi:hypothetical protein